ncbi:alpha/beta hydrolase [Fictibacillus barbaricus]|uniref:Pimeloyl-ACP methyl ester carboxylesterase n=1 Tax=Fictibacillus barbaricus TaxID=182136 RepID=A0ABU1U0C0_9BACL|nr:alpha/beta hydrolase [Fictibacillus barbaricus]MDR7072925.1 pimeloyl-ACP methyl ester carboxylesterase [Fictibacillus barbaricus]
MQKQDCISWRGKDLALTIHYPSSNREDRLFPLLIICHGFTSTRIGVDRLFVKAAQEFESLGFAVIRFDYAGCGESEGIYGENEFADFIDQTKSVISYGSRLSAIDPNLITLIGHSLGGAVAACTAAEDKRIKNAVLWSAVGNPYEDITGIVGYDKHLFHRNLVIDHLGYAITGAFISSLRSFSPMTIWNQYKGNVLFVHGTTDDTISPDYCTLYYKHAKQRHFGVSDMMLIDGANHTFSSIPHFEVLISTTSQWLLKQVSKESHHQLKKSM